MGKKIRLLLLFFLGLFFAFVSVPFYSYGQELASGDIVNNFSGASVKPASAAEHSVSLTRTDDDLPDVVINEFLADPGGDPNGDGVNDSGDEFIEIVNTTSKDIDISGWVLSDDGSSPKYIFPPGTVLPAHSSAVVFGGGKPSGSYGAAVVYTSDGLNLNNDSDSPTLLDSHGNIIQQVSYSSAPGGESLTRDPAVTGDFVPHTSVSTAINSPGTKADGTDFDPVVRYAIALHGNEGWRMISSPTQNTAFSDLFSELWMQGVSGSDAPSGGGTLYSWSESKAAFVPVKSMSDNLEPGKGYIVYIFEDNKYSVPGLQGGFPKIISTDNTENESPVSVPVTSNDSNNNGTIDSNEGWNMLGNPFGTNISVAAVRNALESVNSSLNANVAVWDPSAGSGNGSYVQLQDGDYIAPFRAFWIRYTEAGVNGMASFNRSDLAANEGAVAYDQTGLREESFEILLGNGEKFDKYTVRFNSEGTLGEDSQDAYKLFSLNAGSINLFSTLGEGVKLAINVLPPLNELEREIRIPLRYQLPHSGEYTFRWTKIEELPQNVEVRLIDTKTGSKINLRIRQDFTFSYFGTGEQKLKTQRKVPVLNETTDVESSPRFELIVSFKKNEKPDDAMKKMVTLSPNYPNPFRSRTEMTFRLKEPGPVSITIWNIVGQKVATIYDNQMMSDGPHTYYWNAGSSLPSGIYICKLEAAGTVLIRKMTLIK